MIKAPKENEKNRTAATSNPENQEQSTSLMPPPFKLKANPNTEKPEPENQEQSTSLQKQTETPPSANNQQTIQHRSIQSCTQQDKNARRPFYQHFIRDMSDPPSTLEDIALTTLCSYSIGQLHQMRRTGLRIMLASDLQQIVAPDQMPLHRSPAYVPSLRVLHLGTRNSTSRSAISHELGHSWDHAQTGPSAIRSLTRRGIIRRAGNTSSMRSDRTDIQTWHQSYVNRLQRRYRGRRREFAFGTVFARQGYSLSNPQEFYAEGRAVFHENNPVQQNRLLTFAHELYDHFEVEATREGLAIPSRATVAAAGLF